GARGIAFVADSIDAAIYGYDMLRLGALKFQRIALDGIAKLVNVAAKLPDWLGGGVAADVAGIADLFAQNLDAEIGKLQKRINDRLIAPSSGERVMAFFEGIRAKAEAAGDAAAAIIPDLEVSAGLEIADVAAA